MAELRDGFWKDLPLEALSEAEWEALCDGCGLCCLVKLEDEDTERIYFTDLVCALLDVHACHCTDYANRHDRMPDCRAITPESLAEIEWLPPTCAYRLRQQGKPLYAWHPLVSGEADSVHNAGISTRGWTISETEVLEVEYEDHILSEPFWAERTKIT